MRALCCVAALCLNLGGVLLSVAQARVVLARAVPVAPWSFPDKPSQGVVPEYFKAMFDAAGVPLVVETLPYLRVMQGLKDGSTELTVLIPDAERDAVALRLCQPTRIQSGVIYKHSRYPYIGKPGDLAGKRIGVPRGTKALDELDKVPGVERYPIETVDQGFRMLKLDRLDATFVSTPGSDLLLRESRLDPGEYRFLEVTTSPVVIYVSRRSTLASEPARLEQLRQLCDGPLRKIMDGLMQRYR